MMIGTIILFALIGYGIYSFLKDVPHNAEINRKIKKIDEENHKKTQEYFYKEYGWKIK